MMISVMKAWLSFSAGRKVASRQVAAASIRRRCHLEKGRLPRFVAAILLLAGSVPGFAQTDQDERIRALEQSLEEIKQSIAAGEDVSARVQALEEALASLKADLAAGPSEPVAAAAPPTAEPPAAGVQGAPNPLQEAKRYLTGDDLLDASFPNSWPIPGSDVRLGIGGYAKADFIQDLDFVGDRYEFELATIPVEGSPLAAFDGRTTFTAKETRINFDFRSKAKTRGGREYPLQAFLEIDFFDDREQFSLQPRLRHAYGVIGRLLVGRTWTTSGDLYALPGTIDFSGGDNLYGGRAAQIRWQDGIGERITWAVGLEDPQTSIGNPLQLDGLNRPDLPNLGGRMTWTAAGGSHVQLGADLFRLTWQGGESGPSDTAIGYGLNLTSRLLVGSKGRDALMAGVTVGEGTAHRIISLSFDGGNDAVITENGLDVMAAGLAYVGYSHYWNDSLNSTLSTAWGQLDNADLQPGSAIHRSGSAHLNLIWFPYRLVSTGLEVMWGVRENKDGSEGEAWRLQYMVRYKFE